MSEKKLALITNGKRLDGRKLNEIRPMKIEAGVLAHADGSCYIEMGKTKVIAGVFGPMEFHPKHKQDPLTGILNCRYRMAAFSTEERIRPGPSRRSTEISMVTANALTPALFLREYPKTMVELTIEVLQADASTRVAGINAASVALADAGIPMRDLVTSVAVGKVDGQLVLDVAGKEDTEGETDFPVAMLPRSRKITLMQLDGHLTKDEFGKAMDLAWSGVDTIYKMQVKALKDKYVKEKIATEEVQK
ncbi:MAG: exosome complex exonuclease Rrp41 [archaeon]